MRPLSTHAKLIAAAFAVTGLTLPAFGQAADRDVSRAPAGAVEYPATTPSPAASQGVTAQDPHGQVHTRPQVQGQVATPSATHGGTHTGTRTGTHAGEGQGITGATRDAAAATGDTVRGAADRTADAGRGLAERIGQAARAGADGVNPADEGSNVKGTLQTATQAVLTPGSFDDLVERFTDADRNRIGETMPSDEQLERLDRLVEQINRHWEQRYGSDFGIDDRLAVFDNRYRVSYGEAGEVQQPRLAGGQLSPQAGDGTLPTRVDGQVTEPANPAEQPRLVTRAAGDGEAQPDEGTDIAQIDIPAAGDLPAVSVPMVLEFPGFYKIDVPQHVDGQTLYDNLVERLTAVSQSADQWPADPNDAARLVSHHVLLAVLDGEQQPQGQTQPGQTR